MKNNRIKLLEECINRIKEASKFYTPASPAWTLLQAAWGHVNSLHHLEAKTDFDEKTLGVKFNVHDEVDENES